MCIFWRSIKIKNFFLHVFHTYRSNFHCETFFYGRVVFGWIYTRDCFAWKFWQFRNTFNTSSTGWQKVKNPRVGFWEFCSCINFNDHHVAMCVRKSNEGMKRKKIVWGNRLQKSTLKFFTCDTMTIWHIILKTFFIWMSQAIARFSHTWRKSIMAHK